MKIQELLSNLDFGNQVAEFDKDTERHFIVTEAFRALIEDKADIVAGDKGSGKTTIYNYLKAQYTHVPELLKVEIISGFNPSGSPVFQRLLQLEPLSEGQYLAFWKMYTLSLVGNWLLQLYEGSYSETMNRLNSLLKHSDLRSADNSAETVFSRLTNLTQRFLKPKNIGVEFSHDALGNPTITPKLELGDPSTETKLEIIPYDEGLTLLNAALEESDITVWVLLDKLDEAFVGFPQIEIPALRALLRAYLDLLAFDHVCLKLFVRKDLMKKIVRGGFVNLTHLNARKTEIIWEKEDLFALVCLRIKSNNDFLRLTGLSGATDQKIFETVFSARLEAGERKPITWNWILSQIRDGNDVVAPRNLVGLMRFARDEQRRREQREGRLFTSDEPIIESESLKRALTRLSEERVDDTLLAEASRDVAVLIEGFRGSKQEQDDESISKLFGVNPSQAHEYAETLIAIGLLERNGENQSYKIAPLYRDGLGIHRGKA
ncbi:MAG: P-loop ATPase, Sll1717 family [Bacteroidota bacterium]